MKQLIVIFTARTARSTSICDTNRRSDITDTGDSYFTLKRADPAYLYDNQPSLSGTGSQPS